MAAKYYIIDEKITDQLISDSRAFMSNKVWDENTRSMKGAKKLKHTTPRRRASKPEKSIGILLWEVRYRTSDISNMSGMVMNSERSENDRCLNS